MNEQEVALHVASKLTGNLYVGQRIRTRVCRYDREGGDWYGREGVITAIGSVPDVFGASVKLDGSDHEYHFAHPESIIV